MGDYVRLSEGACVETGGLDIGGPLPYSHVSKPIVLGKGVWLGYRSTVLAGVTIGEGSVVGAGAVVTKDVPPNSIAIGCPAKTFPKSKG
ncbi:acyltransferase [Bradyrhizobium sp. CB2312]|uniref:acyltransferase n=1 Tax=Bradyrhizobium sp. CB2312 TaxID=3039155 RepID=UPI0024B253E8|nr:acyltransferase [Bradyrhizobium sp. CB2312]WFU75671.1 acyltransferase [Bradyrhizobium sp. CB2312]